MKVRRRELPAEIPTASMADVAFLLIIFFLVASFYSVTRGIQFSLPKHDEAALTAEPEAAVLIEIAANGSITVDNRGMPLGDLQGYLAPKLQRNPTKSVILLGRQRSGLHLHPAPPQERRGRPPLEVLDLQRLHQLDPMARRAESVGDLVAVGHLANVAGRVEGRPPADVEHRGPAPGQPVEEELRAADEARGQPPQTESRARAH